MYKWYIKHGLNIVTKNWAWSHTRLYTAIKTYDNDASEHELHMLRTKEVVCLLVESTLLGVKNVFIIICNVCHQGDPPKKRGRGRPRKSETLAQLGAKMKKEPPEEDEDDIIDAGAIDDPEGGYCFFLLILCVYRAVYLADRIYPF